MCVVVRGGGHQHSSAAALVRVQRIWTDGHQCHEQVSLLPCSAALCCSNSTASAQIYVRFMLTFCSRGIVSRLSRTFVEGKRPVLHKRLGKGIQHSRVGARRSACTLLGAGGPLTIPRLHIHISPPGPQLDPDV